MIAIAGVVMVVLNGTLTFHLSPVGDLLALGAALLWAIYSILIKPYTEQYDSFLVTRRVFFWGIHHGHSAHAHDGRHAEPHAAVYAAEGTAVVDISRRVRKRHLLCHLEHRLPAGLGVVITNNYLYASPFVTLIVGWLLLGEPVSLMSIIGAVLITVGVICALKKTEK